MTAVHPMPGRQVWPSWEASLTAAVADHDAAEQVHRLHARNAARNGDQAGVALFHRLADLEGHLADAYRTALGDLRNRGELVDPEPTGDGR